MQETDFVLYTTPNGEVKLEVFLKNETLWLTQKMMAELFDCTPDNISLHLKNIYSEKELDEKRTSEEFSVVQNEGGRSVSRAVNFYNLDAIIAVGYRVNSSRATQFRIWATQVLKEYIIKGFALNDDRLKQGERVFGKDYFQQLLERVRSIRASERRIYLQITDIFAECSTDYDPNSEATKEFFATVQNKFHYAITGQTAAEIIHSHADSTKHNMGLTTWKNTPKGRVLSSDVKITKNYLTEKEIKKLERTVSAFFDYIEHLIESRQSFTMTEFAESVNKFLSFNEFRILGGKGQISMERAEDKALKEYEKFNKTQKIESDFDKATKKILNKGKKK
ncbi:virulence RhuM family protein [Patescibacteria group bacterium]|nr:virulence RhuM family protein [Patescibacteria group bacterium]MBU1016224.1 virulence RhuM family protein [Patescibacteria group bacterium]